MAIPERDSDRVCVEDYNQTDQKCETEDKESAFPVGWKVNIEGLKDSNNRSQRASFL